MRGTEKKLQENCTIYTTAIYFNGQIFIHSSYHRDRVAESRARELILTMSPMHGNYVLLYRTEKHTHLHTYNAFLRSLLPIFVGKLHVITGVHRVAFCDSFYRPQYSYVHNE